VPQRDSAQLDGSLPLKRKTTSTTMNLKVNAHLEMKCLEMKSRNESNHKHVKETLSSKV
jgi:hypothetical protein